MSFQNWKKRTGSDGRGREQITMDTAVAPEINNLSCFEWAIVRLFGPSQIINLSCSSQGTGFNDFGLSIKAAYNEQPSFVMRHYAKESWIQTTLPHLVEVGPVGADGQLYLSPGASGWT